MTLDYLGGLNVLIKVKVKVAMLSHVRLFVTPCTIVHVPAQGILQARILERVAFPFSRDQTQVSYIAEGFFTS